jgi:hypothetical protein
MVTKHSLENPIERVNFATEFVSRVKERSIGRGVECMECIYHFLSCPQDIICPSLLQGRVGHVQLATEQPTQ